ncbi:MAG TPA: HAD family hydrolase [Candidatus Nanoarchaeia archaeon]|nr:HAD family hydrolase [Candidatus Nanoarchaeia archaeon]
MIKAVIFDVDGVLLDSFEANLEFYRNLMAAAGYAPPTHQEFPKIFHLSMWDAIKHITSLDSEEEIRKIWEMGRSRKIKYPTHLLTTPPHTEETIELLSKKYSLGIVTSRIRESVYEAPALSKLQKYFQTVVAYQDTDNHKPHPEPLFLACERLQVKPQQAIYVGDVENDITAGKAAGMKVIIYSEKRFERADKCTKNFRNLPSIIYSL